MTARTLALSAAAALALSACSQQSETAASNTPASAAAPTAPADGKGVKLLNVSYDVSRDFYKEYNEIFIKSYQEKHSGAEISVQQSHGGSSKQALSVANGLAADVVTMNQTSDIELLENKGLVKSDWRERLPDQAVPFTSTTVFLVRKGNPKQIQDWGDLAKDGIQVVLANPKTSGNGRYAFLGAYGYGLKANNGDEAKTKEYVSALLKNTPVFENGGRAATTTFSQRNIGDVLVTFENEANHVSKHLTKDQFEIVYPSYTIVSKSPVAVVDSVAEKKGTQEAAKEYLEYLWSEPAQELAAKLYLRPSNQTVAEKHRDALPAMETFDPNEKFGTWPDIMKNFFADGGLVDQLMPKK